MAIDFYLAIDMITQAEMIRGPYSLSSVPLDAPVALPPKPSPTAPEPTPKATRSRAWIGIGLISLVFLFLLAVGGYRLLFAGPNFVRPTETLNPIIPNTGISPLPSATQDLLPPTTRMVKIPADTYWVGEDPANENQSASKSISLPDFWIDQYQVTNEDYKRYVTEWSFPSGKDKHPVIGVTWDQADAYCKLLNKRLPTEAEWEAAGRGRGASPQLYPWGNDYGKSSVLPVDDTYVVGTQPSNKSPFDVFDLVGNVYEWVGEPYTSVQDGYRVLRGSRYGNVQDLAYRIPTVPNDPVYIKFAGFRCAANNTQ